MPPSTASLAAEGLECGYVDDPCVIGDRTYNVLVPNGDGPFPTLVFFHGSRSSGNHIASLRNLMDPFLARGYAVIAPTALDVDYANGIDGSGWIWEGERNGRDDCKYVRDVVDDAQQRFPLDAERLVLSGHSNGAFFVWYMACADIDPRFSQRPVAHCSAKTNAHVSIQMQNSICCIPTADMTRSSRLRVRSQVKPGVGATWV